MPTAPHDADFIAIQQALAGQYSLERELGRGGMGIVYLAREVQLERPVAIKVLPPVLAARPELRERFMREARTAARLSHPNIVPIFRVDEIGGFVFFVMAYVDGDTLSARVRGRGPLAPHVASRMIQEIAWALAYAHARGVIHRDIKPDNILIERDTGRSLVTDFGIAHVTESSALTEIGHVMGTAHFMSPEQAAGESLDGRSDIYSLGVVAFFALTGRLPFDGPSVQAILARHLTQPPPAIASLNPAVPSPLARAVECCLAKTRDERFASGEALADAIAEAAPSRTEMAVPLRVWLTRSDPLKPVYISWSGIFIFFLVMTVIASFFGEGSTLTILALGGLAAIPLAPLGAYRLVQTRRVLAAGYGLEDMRRALYQHVAAQREEVAFEDRRPSIGGRILRGISYASLAVVGGIAGLTALPTMPITVEAALATLGGACAIGGVTALLGLTYPGRRVRRMVPGELRLRLWGSRAGEWLHQAASIGVKRERAAANLQRPTEIAIGMAASDLFAALPKPLQKELPQLPATVRALEGEAQRMRQRVEELTARIAEVSAEQRGGGARFGANDTSVSSRRQDVVQALTAARDAAGRQLSTVVAALENIRLDLLRLQAGGGTTGSLTELINVARRIGGEVDDALGSRSEVDGVLDRVR